MLKEISLGYFKMNVDHFTSSQYHQSTWNGGKTTELFLFPPEADYQRRVFDYRISSATIEEQYSMFTVLPGYNRLLMPLEGSVTLTNSEQTVRLETFDVGEFDGELSTTSVGKCVDFNLIYKKSMQGEMKRVQAHNSLYSVEKDCYLYCVEKCTVKIKNATYFLKQSDSLALTGITERTTIELLPKDDVVKLIYASCN